MNLKYKDIVFCRNCNAPIGEGWRVQKRKYCSLGCQMRYQQKMAVKKWLDTGICDNHNKLTPSLRQHVLKEQNNKCAICQERFEWLEKPLGTILDHIDGNFSNAVRSNVRLICPNCDSQLPTYKNRNKGKGRATRRQRYQQGKSY